jgi:hypothetical protein
METNELRRAGKAIFIATQEEVAKDVSDKLNWAAERIEELENKEKEILSIAEDYGGYDGGHHKQYALNEIVKIITGDKYEQWVNDYENGEDGPNTYEWDKGIA